MPQKDEIRQRGGGEQGSYTYHGRGVGGANGEGGYGERETGKRPRFGGVFRSNPTLLLILADILLIILIATIIYPLLRGQQDSTMISGYSFTLHAYREGEWAYVNLVVEQRAEAQQEQITHKEGESALTEGGDALEAEPQVEVRFSLAGNEAGDRHLFIPPRRGNPRIVRSRLKAGDADSVSAEIRFGEELRTVKEDL